MNIGMIGMGKLGLPVAVAMSSKHHVIGYDVRATGISDFVRVEHLGGLQAARHKELGPTKEDDFQEHLENADLYFAKDLLELVRKSEIIFVAVQTPHLPMYEGITRLPEERADFDYSYLIQACEDLAKVVRKHQIVVIISTVLPGTMRENILPVLQDKCLVVYNPSFIAMGTVMYDFLHPEFVLMGSESREALERLAGFYQDYHRSDLMPMSIESAELTKVAYNTFITMKVVYANMLMEMCHKVDGCNLDDITCALAKATDRLLSPKYMQGGMGDGGACHPRDNIALSYLSDKLNLSHNLFDDLMMAREQQAEWLVRLMMEYDLPKVILGKSFKAETNIVTGSAAILCANILKEYGAPFTHYDPHIDDLPPIINEPSVFLIATKHKVFLDRTFPKGSVVIDPHRYIPSISGVKVVRVGEHV